MKLRKTPGARPAAYTTADGYRLTRDRWGWHLRGPAGTRLAFVRNLAQAREHIAADRARAAASPSSPSAAAEGAPSPPE